MTTPPLPPGDVPFVSVIVPTRARRALLERLLATLLAQDWPRDRYEIIVVNNHTPDGTDAFVTSLAARSEVAIQYYRTDFAGAGASRQFGAERARGSVLAFIDDDCRAAPSWIAAGARTLAQGYALVQGRTLPDPSQPRQILEKTIQVDGPTMFFETCNIFYDAAVFRAVGGFPAAFHGTVASEDTALGWTVLRAGHRAGFTADALVHHEVFRVSVASWFRAVIAVGTIHAAVRIFPEMRRHLFLRYFVSPLTAAFDAFAVGIAGAILIHPALLVLGLPYLWLRFTDRGRFKAPHILLARFLFGLPRAAMLAGVLFASSLRARCVVL